MSTHQKVKAYGITKIKILDIAMFICSKNVLCVLHQYKPGSGQMAHTEIFICSWQRIPNTAQILK